MTKRARAHASTPILGILVLCLGVTTGCGIFGPDEKDIHPPEFKYPSLSTPESVVLNLKYSWERRDSLRTKEIYDDAYQGTSTDTDGSITFSKGQEVETVWAMGKSQDIQRVAFTLPPEATWIRLKYSSDPAEWIALQLPGVNIQVDDVVHGTQLANSASLFEFKFVPTVDTASPTDTTWKIIRWTEVKN